VSHSLQVRVPQDDQIMEAAMATAHAEASAGAPGDYDRIMEERCSELLFDRPAYWAQVWPAAVAAGKRVLANPELVSGRRVLEVGCGLGVASTCAALAGASSVLATDIEADAVSFAAHNAHLNGVGEIVSGSVLDWSDKAGVERLLAAAAPFDVVIAADVVYDESAPPILARLMHEVVANDGLIVLTDNDDRPYQDERRVALLHLLCEEGDFISVDHAATDTTIRLDTRQGDTFVIAERTLRRLQS
jgi:predicted nicotinamide N-methyase